MIAVVVIEPHALLRFGILQHLAEVMPASHLDGADYAALADESPSCPDSDLALLSVPLNEDVHRLIDATRRVYAPKRMLLLSDGANMPDSWRNLPAVVAGYIPRNTSPDVLAASIRLVLVGGKCFQASQMSARGAIARTPAIVCLSTKQEPRRPAAVAAIPASSRPSDATAVREAELLNITPRQYEVLVLLARGYPIKTVSRHLHISVATAKAHTETLYQRLDAHNRNEAVYTAVARGATLGWHQLAAGATVNAATVVSAVNATKETAAASR